MLARVTPTQAISVDGLTLTRGNRRVLDQVCFDVEAGEVVGLLGPNGAGKTTALGVLSTLIAPAAGSIRIAGHELATAPGEVRRAIGRVPQEVAVYPAMTALENTVFFARLRGMRTSAAREEGARVLDRVGLTQHIDEPAATFSGGMLRRLSLACGLLGSPPVLLLDEPTVGVDPHSRERILDALRDAAKAGRAILYSTHLLGEAEQLCDRVVLIDHGHVVAAGRPEQLIRDTLSGLAIDVVTAKPLPDGWLDGLPDAQILAAAEPERLRAANSSVARISVAAFAVAPEILRRATVGGDVVNEFHVRRPSLQDAFLALTGRRPRD